MKKAIYLIAMFISLSVFARAQDYDPKYQLVLNTAKNLGYNIGQAWSNTLEQGQYFTKTFTFDAGVQYDIIAFSEDDDVQDVDIQVLTPAGYVYVQDTKTSRYAEVTFTPTYNRTLTIKVKNYSSNNPYYASKVYFLVAYKYSY